MIVLLLGAKLQYDHADALIKQKKDSYLQMKQGFEFIKQNTQANAVIVGNAIQPYTVYYGERQYIQVPPNSTDVAIVELGGT